jgi:hypothetical protein
MKHTPKSYAQAVEALAGRDSIKLGNNTWLVRAETYIAVRLHATHIVKFWEDGRVILHSGGYHTTTTKDRINKFITGRVYQKDYQWYFMHDFLTRVSCAFEDGMNVA